MINKTFYICTYRDGRQYPIISVAPKEYEMLYELGMYHLSKSEGVKLAVENLDKVENGELYQYELSAGDWCVVDVKKDKSVITNNFDEFEPIEIPTLEIVKLMKDWFDFLSAYENGEIPGITHPDKRDLA
ncbi:MAG: hypothetical protein R2828_03315 [Saprospiraceae bacterium]